MRKLVPDRKVQGQVAMEIRKNINQALKDGSCHKPHLITILSGRVIRAKYFKKMPIDLICGRDDRDIFFKFRIDCISDIKPKQQP